MSLRRAVTAGVLAVLALGSCAVSSPGPSASAGPSNASLAPFAVPGSDLADALRDAIDPGAILADLAHLGAIAGEHGGVRAAGTEGYTASASFVADELRQAGFDVELDALDVPLFSQADPGVMEILADGAPTFAGLRDFKPMLFSGSGDLTAAVYSLGFDAEAVPGERNGLGCDSADWADMPVGVIVLTQPGPCRRRQAVEHAQQAGALALVTAYPDWSRDGVLRPTLIDPDGVEIPVIGATHALGVALDEAAAQGQEVRLAIHTSIEWRTSANVIASTPGGDPEHVVMLGGHLDSVIDGPGINDNGSGTMTVLEIARQLARLTEGQPAWQVRVAFWSGEELGFWGSFDYANALTSQEQAAIAVYLNFDMLGSPNGVRLVYDAADASRAEASTTIEQLFEQAFDEAGLTWDTEALGGASDHYAFDQLGIPVGGLFSGANEIKTDANAGLFGGTAGTLEDACYHLPCDTIDNVDATLLEQMARAAAWVVGQLASGVVELGGAS